MKCKNTSIWQTMACILDLASKRTLVRSRHMVSRHLSRPDGEIVKILSSFLKSCGGTSLSAKQMSYRICRPLYMHLYNWLGNLRIPQSERLWRAFWIWPACRLAGWLARSKMHAIVFQIDVFVHFMANPVWGRGVLASFVFVVFVVLLRRAATRF